MSNCRRQFIIWPCTLLGLVIGGGGGLHCTQFFLWIVAEAKQQNASSKKGIWAFIQRGTHPPRFTCVILNIKGTVQSNKSLALYAACNSLYLLSYCMYGHYTGLPTLCTFIDRENIIFCLSVKNFSPFKSPLHQKFSGHSPPAFVYMAAAMKLVGTAHHCCYVKKSLALEGLRM